MLNKGIRFGIIYLDDGARWRGDKLDMAAVPFIAVLLSSDLEPGESKSADRRIARETADLSMPGWVWRKASE